MVTTAAKVLNATTTSHPKGNTMQPRVQELLLEIGPGKLSDVAYETAWVARLGKIDWELSSRALAWLSEHQLRDGSWGSEKPYYYHDRLISTLAAMIALNQRGRRAQDHAQIERGLFALERIVDTAAANLHANPNGATVGFEMIVPTLVAEAEQLGIIKRQGELILGELSQSRRAKMEKLAGQKISKFITAAHSAEMAGTDNLNLLDAENLQEENGSVANNPASTAYFALTVRPGDSRALAYLNNIIGPDGGVPPFAPFDIFERLWILWNLSLTQAYDDPEIRNLCQGHLDYIHENWKPGQGLGFSASYSLTDGDNTMIGYEILSKAGREVDVQAVFNYEEADWFRCYHLERNASIDVNIHALGALRQAGFKSDHPAVRKALNFIRLMQAPDHFWSDKWHVSPFYTTAHAIILCSGYQTGLCTQSVEWIIKSQKADGSWGFYEFSTAEETAHCLQALIIWKRQGGKVPAGCIEKGSHWLAQNSLPPGPPFWIDKSLYCPQLVVQSSILSAIILAEEENFL